MTENDRNEILFDALCKAAFTQYVTDEAKKLPSQEETDALFPAPKKGLRHLKRALKAKKHGKPLSIIYLRRAAVIMLATVSFAFGILLSNNEIRASIKDTIVEWYNEYIGFNFCGEKKTVVENENEEKLLSDYEIGYIPDGFELVDTTEFDHERSYMYCNEIGEYVCISITDSTNSTINADHENAEYTEITINGNTAYFLYDDTLKDGSITWSESVYTITVFGNTEKQELIKTAENIE